MSPMQIDVYNDGRQCTEDVWKYSNKERGQEQGGQPRLREGAQGTVEEGGRCLRRAVLEEGGA